MILDLHSRRVIGWAVSNRMKRDLAIQALKMVIALRTPPGGCAHHTDRGSQYCSHDCQKIAPEIYSRSDRRWPSKRSYRRPAPVELQPVKLKSQCPQAAAYVKTGEITQWTDADNGTRILARAMTVIETAKVNGLDPLGYLPDFIDRIHDHKINRLNELQPWNWAPPTTATKIQVA